MIGRILSNRYKLLSEVGSGGMAHVYLAEDLVEGQRVAVKVLYPQYAQDVAFLRRFGQEAKLAMSLSQPSSEMHIARVLDYGSDRDTHYLVMDYVDGRDLRGVLDEDGPLPWREALGIGRQVAVALECAHERGIVHRDVKPQNIMVLPDGGVRVLDFGIARSRTSPTLTHSGFIGSPHYVAPEQAMGSPVDIRADLYSLGIVLYEALCGQLPFQSEISWVVINHHIATPPPSLAERCPGLPERVERLIRKAVAKRPDDRFQTPTEFIQAIEAVLSGLDLPAESQAADAVEMGPFLAELYNRALEAVQAQDWQDAVDLFSQILRFDPRYRDVADQLAEAGRQARLSALYAAAKQSLEAGHWAEALAQLEEVLQIAPDYRDAREMHTHVSGKHELDRLYRKGVERLEAGDSTGAIQCLEQVLDRDPEHARAAELLAVAHGELEKTQQQSGSVADDGSLSRRSERRRNLLWALVAVLILALAVESILLYRSNQPRLTADARTAAASTSAVIATTVGDIPVLTTVPSPVSTPNRTSSTARPAVLATRTPVLTPSPSPTVVRPVAPLSGRIAFPRFDPARGTYDIYICGVDGSGCRQVVAEASQPQFLPGGDQLVVHSWKPDEKGLVLHVLSEQRIWRITDELEAARPSVDFEGKTYVYHSRQEADREPRLYRTYGTDTQPIYREGSIVMGWSPAWLLDGRILYCGCWLDSCGILVMRADGTYPRQVVAGVGETNPEAAPDGEHVTFMSQRDGNWEVYVVHVDGSGLRRLTQQPGSDGLPVWSPDGRHIAFVSDRDGEWAVWAMRPDGSQQRRLFSLGGTLDGKVQDAAAHETHGWLEERISWGPLP